MAPDLQSKPLPSACPRLAVLESIFLLLPARKHGPLARRKEHPRPSLPANAPNPRSAHCVARVLLLPLPPRFPVSHKPAPQARFFKPASRRRESCANQISQSAEAAPLITQLERDRASVEAALRRHLAGRGLALTARAWRLLGFSPEEMVAIFPSGWYIKSSIPLPPNPDSEFLSLDSYSPLVYGPDFPS